VRSDDYTFFRHIDMNVSNYFRNDYDDNIIQESVSLDDENLRNCTKIVSEFYQKIRDWWVKMKSREHVLNDHVTKLTKIWLSENEAKFENFVLVLCYRENVRIKFLMNRLIIERKIFEKRFFSNLLMSVSTMRKWIMKNSISKLILRSLIWLTRSQA
jgi:hypothetical protein